MNLKSSHAARRRLPGYAPTQRIGQRLELAVPGYIGQAGQTGLAESLPIPPRQM